jgi:rubrerythrin
MLAQLCMSSIARSNEPSANAADHPDDECIDQEIKKHRDAIALYEDEASSSDAQLSTFAQAILPQLRRHLAILESLKSRLPLGRRS